MTSRPKVLILAPWFLPGEQGGGSVLAVKYLVEQLGTEFEFVIGTGDRDFGATHPYAPQDQQASRQSLNVSIHYFGTGWQRLREQWTVLNQPFDLVYANSVLSLGLAFLPLLMRRLTANRHARLLIAPRGELQHRLLAMKGWRKRIYLQVAKALGLFKGAQFHATSTAELQDLQRLKFAPVLLVPDLSPTRAPCLPAPRRVNDGPLRVAFVSRIDRNKNLAQVLRVLTRVNMPVQLDIAGPVGEADYWADCSAAMARLPAHVTVRKLGALPHTEVLALLVEQELFFLPTWSENHGYVIHEALLAGCALLISDQTPWRGLARRGVGFDLPLGDDALMVEALTAFAAMPADERLAMRQRARAYGLERLDNHHTRAAMRDLLLGS